MYSPRHFSIAHNGATSGVPAGVVGVFAVDGEPVPHYTAGIIAGRGGTQNTVNDPNSAEPFSGANDCFHVRDSVLADKALSQRVDDEHSLAEHPRPFELAHKMGDLSLDGGGLHRTGLDEQRDPWGRCRCLHRSADQREEIRGGFTVSTVSLATRRSTRRPCLRRSRSICAVNGR